MISKIKKKIIIGTWPFSGELGKVDFKNIHLTIDKCIELGFNQFDTAPNYGNGFCESLLGKVLQNDKKIINTKFGNSAYDGKSFSIDSLHQSINHSLSRLGIEKVDILFLHNPRNEIEDYDRVFSLFEKLKQENKIHYAGISLARNHIYGKELEYFDVVQSDYNLLYQNDISAFKINNKKCFQARSVLATGILSGKLSLKTKFDETDYRSTWLKGVRLESIMKRIKIIEKFTEIPLHSLSRRFVLFNDLIDKVIIGVKTPKQVLDINSDIKAGPLDSFLSKKLRELYLCDFDLINEKRLSF